jgi:hypothetical protein
LFEEEAEEKCETSSLPFEERRKIIEEFYKENLVELRRSKEKMLSIEKENMLYERRLERGIDAKLKCWKFLRCANGKLKITRANIDEKIDPIMERKRVLHWGQNNNITFDKKRIPIEEIKKSKIR